MFFRKIKYAILSLIAFVVIGVGAGVSYWVYAQEGFNKQINSDSNIDNIYENYTFGKESITDKYDIYFFPSTYYLYRFANGGSDVNGGTTTGPTDKPENIYGYLKPNETNSGFLYEKPPFESNRSAINTNAMSNQYHLDINGLTKDGGFSDLDSYEEASGWFSSNKYNENLGTYLSIDIHNSNSNYSYKDSISTQVTTETGMFGLSTKEKKLLILIIQKIKTQKIMV